MAISLLIFLSLGSIHYVTFVFSIPDELHALLDISFKADFAANFAIVATFSMVAARYVPQAILAIGVLAVSSVIRFIYYRRGYRRVASPLEFLDLSKRTDKTERIKLNKRLRSFGRNDARMDNFVRTILQRRLPILFYEDHRLLITSQLAVLTGLFFYVGSSSVAHLFSLSAILAISLHMYLSFSDRFRFSLQLPFSGDDPEHQPRPLTFGADDLFVVAATCAVVVGIAGPLRLQYLRSDATVRIIYGDSRTDAALVGSTAHGLIVFDQDYGFIPFSEISQIRRLSRSE